LDLSKIEAGKLEVDRVRFSLGDLLANVRSLLYPLANDKHLELKFHLQNAVPEFICSDPVKLRHILINIVGNAIKFSHEGDIDIRMSLGPASSGYDELIVQVQDHGTGMNEEQSRNLFKPFTQVDNSMTRRYGGTGLGLTLSRKFAQALQGDVNLLESLPGKGSIFEIRIRAEADPSSRRISSLDELLEGRTETRVNAPEVDLSGMHILLVEDAPENQFLVTKFLQDSGAKTQVASNGLEAMDMAFKDDFDLVLMDIQMPVLDGYQATSRLRYQGYKKPIVALTAHALKEERERCLKIGFDEFLTKPIKKIELLQGVAKFRQLTH
jgi:CheY-like chemotaxis protein